MNLTNAQNRKLWYIELEPHVSELKNRTITVLIVGLVLLFVNFFLAERLLAFVTSIYKVISIVPYDTFNSLLFIDGVLTVAMLFPIVLYSLAKYLEPAIEDVKIFKSMKRFFIASIVLFYVGCAFGLIVFSTFLLNYFTNFSSSVGVEALWSVNKLIEFFGFNAIVFGLLFQIPIGIFLVIKHKVIKPKFLTKLSFFGVPVVLGFSAFITPPDIISMFLMALPVFVLFYGSIFIAKLIYGGEK